MNQIQSTEKLFFELIRVAISTQDTLTRAPSAQEWKQLYDMAKRQSLVGICFAGVQRLQTQRQESPKMLYFTWLGMAAMIQQRNEVVNKQCRELSVKLNADGFEHSIMKGQQVGRYYGELAALRQSGDIDVWVKGGMKKVVGYVQSISPTSSMSHKHVHLNVFADTSVEMHYIPAELHCPWWNRRLNVYFDEHSQFKMVADDEPLKGVFVPTDEFNVMHLVTHAFRHLFGEGMTMRQLMDLYFVLMKWEASAEAKVELCKEIEACGMLTFTRAMMYAMEKVLGMPKEKMICEGNREDGELLINLIMDDSNADAQEKRRRAGEKESAFGRFVRVQKLNMRLLKIASLEVFWTPLWRIWNWCWMRKNGYTDH